MIKYSKISSQRIRRILELFLSDFTATQSAEILGLSRNTLNRYYGIFREEIVELSIEESQESGEFEVDESYFGAKRVRWKRGRWAAGKTPVFGLLKRHGNVYVSIVEDCSRDELMPIIQGKVLEWSTIHSDGWKAYDWLILNGYDHYRVFHSHNEFVRWKSHVNGIEAFWSFAKRRMSKLNGIRADKFHLHLKECEFRYNYRNKKEEALRLLLKKLAKR
jgi:transposase